MQRIIRIISSVVRRAPKLVIGVAIGLTLVFGALTGQQEQASGNEGFSPDSEEFLAAQTIDDVFTSSSEVAAARQFTKRISDFLKPSNNLFAKVELKSRQRARSLARVGCLFCDLLVRSR